MSKEDPKHGRWILPVVIAALIGFTYLFVTALPPAEIPVGTTTTVVASETTTSIPDSTTTTTLSADIAAFLSLVDDYEATANTIANDIDDTNTAWENRTDGIPSFDDTLAAFEAAKVEAQTLSDSVEATNPPDAYTAAWPDSITAAAALPPGVDTVIEGLRAPDDGTARREAVDAYEVLTTEFIATLTAVKNATP
ncbi:MAG: hypothetical protein U9R51_07690 [Actinomycetota bacterium]|nr:hypothetical protein [Actinomycetota bacterium]